MIKCRILPYIVDLARAMVMGTVAYGIVSHKHRMSFVYAKFGVIPPILKECGEKSVTKREKKNASQCAGRAF